MNDDGQRYERLSDYEYTSDDFEELLDDADLNATKAASLNFVSDMREKFEEFGHDMYLSPKQLEWLKKLAEAEEEYRFNWKY